ncbi:MAG: sugar phosphate isomerase/epimerase family protein [Saccharofermentanales bacterium]
MKTSVCCGIENIGRLESLGIDMIELSAAWISQLDDTGFQRLKRDLRDSSVGFCVCNCLMHNNVVPLFLDADFKSTKTYLAGLFSRLGELNLKYAVFGSGNYRKIPESIRISGKSSPDSPDQRMMEFLVLLTDIARIYNITIVIEPLNHNETNTILTSTEATGYIDAISRNNLQLLIDLYHFDLEKEDFGNIIKYKNHIKHVHISKPVTRSCPKTGDGYDYNGFFSALKKSGYDGIISIESALPDFIKDISEARMLIENSIRRLK